MTAEVKPQFSPLDEAIYYLMDSISETEEEVDMFRLRAETIEGTVNQMPIIRNILARIRLNWRKNLDLSKVKKLEDMLGKFDPALDSLIHDNNPRPTIALLEDQTKKMRTYAKDENAGKIQDLKRLATDLSRTA